MGSVMRQLLLILPAAAILLAGGVLFAGLGRSLANTEVPPVADIPAAATAVPAGASEGEWTETARKPPKPPKSPHKKPDEPQPRGSRR
jgi:hypothetical protein